MAIVVSTQGKARQAKDGRNVELPDCMLTMLGSLVRVLCHRKSLSMTERCQGYSLHTMQDSEVEEDVGDSGIRSATWSTIVLVGQLRILANATEVR